MSALKKAFSRQSSVVSLLIFTILFIANLFIFTSPAFAQTPTSDKKCNLKVGDWCVLSADNFDDKISNQNLLANTASSTFGLVTGTVPGENKILLTKVDSKIENGQTVLTYTPVIAKGSINNGALAMTTQGIIALYNPPTSSVEYLANLGENMGIASKNAYAQSVTGSGAGVISPVLKLWQVMRNIAYIGFILVFITSGVMIMFRQKLNPQTVIGIQQALPGLIVGLILVTFSYFIAAFIVDLTFVGMRLVAAVFTSSQTSNFYADDNTNPKATFNDAATQSDAFAMYGKAAADKTVKNVGDFAGSFYGVLNPTTNPTTTTPNVLGSAGGLAVAGCAVGLIATPIGCVVGAIGGAIIGTIVAVANFNPVASAGNWIISSGAAILVALILAIALMIQFIRLIIALLMSYIQILVMVIFGPFLILFSAIPGKGGVLGYWLKGLIANVLVFPAVFAGFLFAGMLLNFDYQPTAAMPLFGGVGTSIIGPLLAFGILLALPSIPDMVREALGVKGVQGFSKAALGGFMGGVNTGRAMATGGYNQAMEKTGMRAQQQAYQKAKLEAGSESYTRAGGTVTGGPAMGRVRRWLVER